MKEFLKLFLPPASTVSFSEKLRSAVAVFIAIFIVVFISQLFLPQHELPWIVASLGASAALLFAVPLGPFSQPWSFAGGHLISAFVGISVAKLVPDLMLASALAVGFSVFFMSLASCLHPPGAATGLSAVVGGSAISDMGYSFMLFPVLINIVVMLSFALIINNLLPHRYYPNTLKAYKEKKLSEKTGILQQKEK
jgi:CBS-domain-containing membrane protein